MRIAGTSYMDAMVNQINSLSTQEFHSKTRPPPARQLPPRRITRLEWPKR